jgi:hypothetical protein
MDAEQPLRWNETLDENAARLAYEHAREAYRALETAADGIDRKVLVLFTVSSAVVALAPLFTAITPQTASWGLWLIGGSAWAGSAFWSWQAFKPRDHRTDPNPRDLATAEWLGLEQGPYYLARLHYVAAAVEANERAVADRGKALRYAFAFALIEVGLVVAALLVRR